MANPANNPLFKHFRQPSIYLKLPSGGQYWDDDAIDLPTSGEIPIYPMTVKDEIILKTPDALMNGEGMIKVIESCCPNIKDAWKIPVCDLDPILISMRLASYGNDMDIRSICPKCDEANENVLDLSLLLDNYKMPSYGSIKLNKLTVTFKPQYFATLNKANLVAYEQQRLLNIIGSSDLTEEQKSTEFNKILPKITEMNVENIIASLFSITTEDGTVVKEERFIREFIDNCERKTYDAIKTKIEEESINNRIEPVQINCVSCEHEYKSTLNFENSNFFG